MKNQILATATVSALLFGAGCASTQIYDPASTQTGIRQEGSVSSEEMRQVALAAVQSAMTNSKFTRFLKNYQKEQNDPEAIPVVKLSKCVNDTDDPDLNVNEMTDMINDALLNAGKVDVTMAEGVGLDKSIGESRDVELDENFKRSTVAKRGTLIAARLTMRPKIVSNTTRDGGKKAVVRTFTMDMADIHTGLVMWRFTKQLGFVKTKGTFGW